MEDLTVYIYGLSDLSGNIRYIGQSVNPWLRYEQFWLIGKHMGWF